MNRLILFEQILAIENDPHFNGGNYYDNDGPLYGLGAIFMALLVGWAGGAVMRRI